MTEQGKYGEPWITDGDSRGLGIVATNRTPGSRFVAEVHFREDLDEAQAIRDRIVSCVNALAGRDPEKLDALVEAAREAEEILHGTGKAAIKLSAALAALESGR